MRHKMDFPFTTHVVSVAWQVSLRWDFYAETVKTNSSVELHENSVFFRPHIPLIWCHDCYVFYVYMYVPKFAVNFFFFRGGGGVCGVPG